MTASKIEWTGRSDWNPIRGCTRKSAGCVNCYAEIMAARFSKPGQWGHGFAHMLGGDHRWTGEVEVQWDRLLLPLSWRTPAMIFGSSTSDIFHEKLSAEDIAQIVGVAVAAHHLRGHITQFLTKRSDRMAELTNSEEWWDAVNAFASGLVMERVDPLNRRSDDARVTLDSYGPGNPAPGVWFGVSVEDQAAAGERRENLRATTAAVRFVSYEPAIGPVDWTGWGFVDQIISGGESGPHSRPSHPDWHRATRDFCATQGIAFFFKQWGEWADMATAGIVQDGPVTGHRGRVTDWMRRRSTFADGAVRQLRAYSWTAHSTNLMYLVGKRAAGRLLDGVEHSGMPA